MEIVCDFVQEYLPSEGAPEAVIVTHLANCTDCQDQAVVVDDATA